MMLSQHIQISYHVTQRNNNKDNDSINDPLWKTEDKKVELHAR